MSIIWSFVWALITAIVMPLTIKYYIPRLSKRTQRITSETFASFGDKENENDSIIENKNCKEVINNKIFSIVAIIIAAVFAGICGYVASEHAISLIAMFKMTLAMMILSCVCITDLKLMLIPNLCSLVLLFGRIITIGIEFIWMREAALAWLLNSIIAFVVSLILLLIMSKITKGGLGMGDVKLFSSLGFLCGVRTSCFTLMFAFLLCAVVSTVFLVSKKKHLKDSLPLGPFIWLGYGVTVLLSIV